MTRRALITGGATRLGREMALCLGRRGIDVAVHFHASESAAQDVVEELRGIGRRAEALQADLLVEDRTAGLVARAGDALDGPLDILVNSASIFEHDTIGSMTRESWDRHLGSNLRAPVLLTQAFSEQCPAPTTDDRGETLAAGCVVNLVDQRVLKPTPEFLSYTIAKMGLWSFTQVAAKALAPSIRVNAIGPGSTLKGERQTVAHFEAQRARTILGRGPNPRDINAALLYLLDAPAVTGQLLCVDGGQHLGWRTPDVIGRDPGSA